MQSHWKSPHSPHKILLSFLTRDFILQKRSLPNEEPRIQIHQSKLYIKNQVTNYDIWTPFDDKDFQRIFNELTKKAKLYKVKDFDKLSFTFNQYLNESLFSLIILWDSCSWLTDKSMKHLKKIMIENFPDIKSLAINFYGKSKFSPNALELLAELISSFRSLTSLQMHLVGFQKISDESVKVLVRRIHRSQKNLKNLSIDLSARLEITHLDFRPPKADLFQRLTHTYHCGSYSAGRNLLSEKGVLGAHSAITRYFRTLQELYLSFGYSEKQISDKVCQELGQGILKRMECLKCLTLNFNRMKRCESLTNEAMRLFNKAKKGRLIALDSLTLELADVNIDDTGLKFLEEGICLQFKDLKRLVVNLMSNKKITHQGLKEFNKNITLNLQSLQAYTLACYWSYNMWDKYVKLMNQDICRNMKNLKELVLMFDRMNNSILPAICSDIEENSLGLEKLSLMFKIYSSSPLDLGKFQQVLNTTLKDLVELNLDLCGNESGINNDIIVELGKSLEGLVKLKRLALGFDENKNIGVKIGVLVPKMAVLERFEAFFMGGIEDEHLNEFGASLCEFQKGLRVMHVSLSSCMLLTNNSYKKFCRGIKHDMKELEDLTLDFCECEKISGDVKTEMKVLLREVPLATLY